MELMDKVEEELLQIPKSGISLMLVVRLYDSDTDTHAFEEYTRKSGERCLRLSSSDYLVFKYRTQSKDRFASVFVSYLHMATLKRGMTEAEMFMEEAFVELESGLVEVDPAHVRGIKVTGMIGGKSILMIPQVIYNAESKKQDLVVAMALSEEESSGIMKYTDFLQLVEFIRGFDLYTASKQLLNTMINYCNNKFDTHSVSRHEPPDYRLIPSRERRSSS